MFPSAHRDIRASNSDRQWIWVIPALVLLGTTVMAGVLVLASHSRSGGEVALGAALLGLPALVLMVVALRQAASHARTFLSSSIRWWHVLWMLPILGSLVFRLRSASDIASNPLDGWAIFRVVVDMVVAFILLARLALRRTHWVGSMLRGVVGAITVFGLVGVVSTVWSVFPPWTLYKSCEYLIDIALVAAILESIDTTEEYRSLFNWTWAIYGLLLVTVWLGAVLWPQDALFGQTVQRGDLLGLRLEGIVPAISSNDVGTYAAILSVVCLARLFPSSEERFNRAWYALLLAGSLVTMVLAQTRSAMAGFVLGGFFILLFSKRGKLSTLVTFVVAPIVVLSTMGGLIWSFLRRGETAQQLGTLSSRLDWWSFAWQTYLERPLTGFGAYAGGRFAVLAKMGLGVTSSMHSDYLETIVGTSVWGLIPLVVALLGTWWLLLRYVRDSSIEPEDRQLAFEGLAVLALLTFRSIFNTMLTWHPPLHFLAILGCAEYLRRRRRVTLRVMESRPAGRWPDTPDPQLQLTFGTGHPGNPRGMSTP